MKSFFLFLLLTLLCFQLSYSQTCCSGGVPLSNNIGLPIQEKGVLQLGVSYDYNNLNTLNNGNTKLEDNNRLRITHSSLLNLSYSITNNLSVEGLFSWVNQRRRIKSNQSLNQSSGFGDAILISRYKLYDKNDWTFSFGGGLKLPTGSTDRKSNIGILLNADLQPGSNALDAVFLTSLSKQFNFRKSMTFAFRTTYRKTGVNNEYQKVNKYKFGNETQLFLSITDQFLFLKQIFNPSITIKYRNVLNDKINSKKISNTGGQWLFVRPSFSIEVMKNVNILSSLEIPVYSKVEGIQLTPSYRFNVGFLFQILKPKTKTNYIKTN